MSEIDSLIEILGRWWTDPSLTGLRRLPARATTTAYPDDTTARTGSSGPWVLDLAGDWEFLLVDRPEDAPSGWCSRHSDNGWRSLAVPGCWTRQGTGDVPRYTNVVMPFAGEPGEVPDVNPTGLYRRVFDLPPEWTRRRVVVHLAGAESMAAVWCNGHFVGLMSDSRLPTEFDLTPFVHNGSGSSGNGGRNVLAVMVVRWSAGSWVEDQDHWVHAGLHRGVHLRAAGPVSVEDLSVQATLGPDLTTGSLEITARVGSGGPMTVSERQPDLSGWSIEAVLETIDGEEVWCSEQPVAVSVLDTSSHLAAMGDAYRHRGPIARLVASIVPVRPWSHEDPYRYRVLVRLRNPDGEVSGVVPVLTGFRRVEVKGAELLLNGRAVPIAGVNRHDHHHETGKTITASELWDEVAAIKRAGMNALRTAHYPPDQALLDACDELGVWVLCEANLESHARWRELAHHPGYQRAFVERVQRMVWTHRNHPSVMGWSLGNEAGEGPAHHAAAAWVRAIDPNRYVHYEGGVRSQFRRDPGSVGRSVTTDIVCPMYPSIAELTAWATAAGGRDAPLIMCEYSHAMGNSNGGLEDYWNLIAQHHGLQGGFIWDWRDQGLAATDANGRHYWAVGGAFGDDPHDAAFCCNGLVGPDGTPHPAVEEHRWLVRPVTVERDGGRLALHNRRAYTGIDDLHARALVAIDGVELAAWDLDLPPVPPGEVVPVPLDLPRSADLPDLPAGREAHLTVTLSLRHDTAWAPSGHVVAWDQIALDPAADLGITPPSPTAPAGRPSPTVSVLPDGAEVGTMKVRFDPSSGILTEFSHDGRGLLVAGPQLGLWRAPTDNDGVSIGPLAGVAGARPAWLALGLDSLTHEPMRFDITPTEGGVHVVTEHRWHGRDGFVADHRQQVLINRSGLVRFDEDVQIPDDVTDVPRVGIRLILARELTQLRWYGPGPWETYPDRRRAPVGLWDQTVAEQFVSYVTPQHHGSHIETRWAELTSGSGSGVRLVLDGLTFDASHHSVEQLTAATTLAELEAEPEVHVHIDAALRGAGTAACGPDTTVLVPGGRHHFTWALQAVPTP